MTDFFRFLTSGPYRVCRRACCFLMVTLLCAGAQAEQIYQTTLELEEPVLAAGIDRVEFVWSIDVERKHAGGKELSGLSVALYAGDALVYTDLAISKWLVLPMLSKDSLTERTQQDIFWDFDVANLTLRQFRSILPANLKGSSGEHYQVADGKTLLHDRQVYVRHFVDGELKDRKVGLLLRQSTRLLTSFEPGEEDAEKPAPEQVVARDAESETSESADGTDGGTGTLNPGTHVVFDAKSPGLYIADLEAFGMNKEAENAGVQIGGEIRPVLLEDGVLSFYLAEDDIGDTVELGYYEESLAMDIVDAAPVSVEGDVGFAAAEEGEEFLDLPVEEGTTRYVVSGMKGDEVWLLDVSDPTRPRWLTQQAVLELPDGIGVYFETGTTEVRRVIVLPPGEALELIPEA